MVLWPEHWSPPPNHRDPMLRPCLDDWRLVADMCTHAARWFFRVKTPPTVKEITPTTALVVQLHLRNKGTKEIGEICPKESYLAEVSVDQSAKYASLFEENFIAGFTPMLDLTPMVCDLLIRYSNNLIVSTKHVLRRLSWVSLHHILIFIYKTFL